GECLLIVANLSRFLQPVQLDLSAFAGRVPEELFGRTRFPAITESPYPLTLGPHGFCWFVLNPAPSTLHSESTVVLPTSDWRELVHGQGRRALGRFLQARSPTTNSDALDCRMLESLPLPIPHVDARLLTVRIEPSSDAAGLLFQSLAHVPMER